MAFPMVANDRVRRGLLNFATAFGTGGPGVPGDIGQAGAGLFTGLLNAQMGAIDPTGRVRAMSGQHSLLRSPEVPFSSEAMQKRLGGDPSAPESLLGFIGAPDVTDVGKLVAGAVAKGLLDPSLAMTLFHGTPHKFDVFDLKKIGTGEGAQAYGHGLYFAESPGVAKTYKHKLTDRGAYTINGEPIPEHSQAHWLKPLKVADEYGDDGLQAFIKQQEKQIEFARSQGATDDDLLEMLDELQAADDLIGQKVERATGHLYEVDIPDETIGKMLDWDAPLSEQPESVKEAIRKYARANPDDVTASELFAGVEGITDKYAEMTGSTFYRKLESQPHMNPVFAIGQKSDEAASNYFNQMGIPGIRYYDGASRGKGEGTRNIVVFNPEDIKSVKRDGELVYKAGK